MNIEHKIHETEIPDLTTILSSSPENVCGLLANNHRALASELLPNLIELNSLVSNNLPGLSHWTLIFLHATQQIADGSAKSLHRSIAQHLIDFKSAMREYSLGLHCYSDRKVVTCCEKINGECLPKLHSILQFVDYGASQN